MKARMLSLAVLLASTGLPAAQANGDLEHWLRLCEKPRLEYWDKLCAAALGTQADKKLVRTEPPKPAPGEQAATQ